MDIRHLSALLLVCLSATSAFVIPMTRHSPVSSDVLMGAQPKKNKGDNNNKFGAMGSSQMTSARRKKLGIADDEDEYDLGVALASNTDPLITKIIAGSFIVVLIALLVVGVIIPSTADYGEGVCNPIQNAGRC